MLNALKRGEHAIRETWCQRVGCDMFDSRRGKVGEGILGLDALIATPKTES
jgi:hypothetical protein